jgi:predicted O-methyltransferase YrrM
MSDTAALKAHAWHHVQKMDGWMEETRCSVLIDLVLTHRPKKIVEIGIFGGRSLAAMGFACHHIGEGVVWGIDPWSKEAACEGESEENIKWWTELDIEGIYRTFVQNILNLKLSHQCRWIRMTAEEAAPLFPENSINLLSLDGNHSELASCREARMWVPKIAPQGVIVMDDVHWPSQQKAIQLIRELGMRTIQHVTAPDGQAWMTFQKP